jgi:hypothetical protein
MFSTEVIAMAVKKSTAPKSGTKTAKAKPAVKKAAVKKAAPKMADAKAKAPNAPKGGVKKAAPKKAASVKLTEPQKKFLESVAATKDAGVVGNKGNAKMLATLLEKKLVKKGKKEGAAFRFHITKLGSKHSPASGSPTTTSEPSSAPSA